MHLHFEYISIKRFRSFKEASAVYLDAAGPGLYFLKGKNLEYPAMGPNGVGKSSVIDALLWCLYGKTVHGLKNPDIQTWDTKGTTEVEVYFRTDDIEHSIKRTANPNLLTIDGVETGQDYVDQLIQLPFEIIPFTIILGQRRLLFLDQTAGEKIKLISEAVDLDRWDERSDAAADIVKNLSVQIDKASLEVESLNLQQAQIEADIKDFKDKSKKWEAEHSNKADDNEDRLKKLRSLIASVMNERDTADLKLDRALTELKALKLPLDKLHLEHKKAEKEISNKTLEQRVFAAEQNKLRTQLEELGDVCSMCKQPIKTEKIRKALEKDIKSKIDQETSTVLEKQIRDMFDKERQILSSIEIQEKAKEQFEKEAEDARDTLDNVLPKIAAWEAEIKAIDKAAQESLETSNPFTDHLQGLRRRHAHNRAKIEEAKKLVQETIEVCERTRFWIKGFKDIKLYTIEEILQELEIITNAMCEEFGLVGWRVGYDVERQNLSGSITRGLNVTVLSPKNRTPVKWECWSGGEGQRLRIIGTEALSSVLLNHVGVTTNLAMFDEPTIGLSTEGVQDLVDMLAYRAKHANKSIWFIDHHAVTSNKFVQEVTVVRDKSGSYIE